MLVTIKTALTNAQYLYFRSLAFGLFKRTLIRYEIRLVQLQKIQS